VNGAMPRSRRDRGHDTAQGAGGQASGAPARREYRLALAVGAAGAAAVLLSARQGWARVLSPAPAPLPATAVTVRGQDLVPVAAALAVASIAGLAAVIATRRWPRRLFGCLLAAFGAVMTISLCLRLGSGAMVDAARALGAAHGGSAIAGGPSGAVPGGAAGALPILGTAARVTAAVFPWRAVAVAGALLVAAAGVLVAWRGGLWPAMPSRYGRPAGRGGDGGDGAAGMWEALSRGADPTEGAQPGK
jgi:uncharacterized membrane protein (TIGR02234 family)